MIEENVQKVASSRRNSSREIWLMQFDLILEETVPEKVIERQGVYHSVSRASSVASCQEGLSAGPSRISSTMRDSSIAVIQNRQSGGKEGLADKLSLAVT